MTSIPAPILVADPKQFAQTITALEKEAIISVDTESNSLYSYRERVCLIQFSTPDNDYLVDPLALDDISALTDIFNNPDIEKIFHAAEYDLLCLKRDYDFKFNNLFDTMVAARILGMKKVGLGNLLREVFEIELEKKFQKADWGKRPLPDNMQAYARFDTHYLLKLRNKFKEQLNKSRRWSIAEEDFARLSNVNGNPPGPVDTSIWRVNGSRDLSPQQAAVLQELVHYRDKKAQSYDMPAFKVISEKILLAIAEQHPRTLAALRDINNVSDKLIRRHGRGLIDAVQRGAKANKITQPPRKKYNNGYPERLETLRSWRKKKAIIMGVESDVILPRDLMLQIAIENPLDEKHMTTILSATPWRLKQYATQLHNLLDQSR